MLASAQTGNKPQQQEESAKPLVFSALRDTACDWFSQASPQLIKVDEKRISPHSGSLRRPGPSTAGRVID